MSPKREIHDNKISHNCWAEWRAALFLGLLLMAFLAAPGAKAWDQSNPIIGSIADDLMAIGDRQYGPTEFIVERQEDLAVKVRHQRVTLEGAEIFCTQYPAYTQQRYFGIRVNRYDEKSSVTICSLAEETHKQLSYEEMIRRNKEGQPEERPTMDDEWLMGTQLRTDRAYCIGNFESREFAEAPLAGTWIAEGNVLDYQRGMFTGYEVAADQESKSLFVLSDVLDQEAAREMGCALQPARIVVKISVLPAQNVASNPKTR